VTSWRERTWWRNLRDGGPVKLRLQGKDVTATPEVIEDDVGVAVKLMTCFKLMPRLAQYYQVELDGEGNPVQDDVSKAAKSKVVVALEINPVP
jgi:hypothetical protein